jgi:hypothetical protein
MENEKWNNGKEGGGLEFRSIYYHSFSWVNTCAAFHTKPHTYNVRAMNVLFALA